jgi:Contractile injection system tube protein
MSGELKKLKIIACTNDTYDEPAEAPNEYIASINPEKYEVSYNVDYYKDNTPGNEGSETVYYVTQNPQMSFQFLFDGTGMLNQGGGLLENIPILGSTNATNNIIDQIMNFQSVVIKYDGSIHKPRPLKLIWGTLLFKGKIISLKFEYKLFKPDGTPIRALAHCTFEGSIQRDLKKALESPQSPDLTHIRKVVEGDTLPFLSYKIYGDSKYYLELAHINKLNAFRKLIPGEELIFPPLNKD